MVNFFEQRKKVTLKWVGSCERKERQVKPNVKELKDSKNEYVKVKVMINHISSSLLSKGCFPVIRFLHVRART